MLYIITDIRILFKETLSFMFNKTGLNVLRKSDGTYPHPWNTRHK
jgi:hypothetical protein